MSLSIAMVVLHPAVTGESPTGNRHRNNWGWIDQRNEQLEGASG
jgi:hypothetical protein